MGSKVRYGRTRAAGKRIRRSADEARIEIIEAARAHLVAGGPENVRVQTVAADVGVTDAAIHYHFGSRQGLLDAVMAHAGRQLRDDLERAVEEDASRTPLAVLADGLRAGLHEKGNARLTAWLALHGWEPVGQGMLRRLADRLHHHRTTTHEEPTPELDDTLFVVELLGLALWADTLVGGAWRRSVGLPDDDETADRFAGWLVELLEHHLESSP